LRSVDDSNAKYELRELWSLITANGDWTVAKVRITEIREHKCEMETKICWTGYNVE
jgi:hypothetical protein